jgi:RNA polymerase sigma-B factor
MTSGASLLDAADDLEAVLTCPTTRTSRFLHAPVPARSVELDAWRTHVAYHRRRRAEERRALVERYFAKATRLARQYLRRGEPSEDLEQVALEALLLAIERFDPSRSVPFLGYANPTIVGALKRHYRDSGWSVRVPRRAHELSSAIRDAEELLSHDLRRPPSDGEVADLLGVAESEVVDTRKAHRSRNAASFSAPTWDQEGDDGAASLAWTIAAEDRSIEMAEERVAVEAVVQRLDPQARELLGLYFEDGLTQAEIAVELGVSQMQVSRRLNQVLEQMRSHLPDG